ncbi:MAG TPA: hypothetical protein VFG72_12745 [Marmoricola sp.]|nr:hypothetical protein [Marmoricola sp.]
MNSDRPEPVPPEDPDHRLDIDAAFAEIVAHWEPSPPEEEPETDPDPVEPAAEEPPSSPPAARGDETLRDLFRPAWQEEPLTSPASWDDEGHFVPPPPPPLPTVEPRRKLAWGALVAGPLVALLSFVLGMRVPDWFTVGLVLGFVGGFVYLVATMKASEDDGWPGDDGAVL